MTHAPNEMSSDFRPYADKIAALVAKDENFASLIQTYEELNTSIYNAEQDIAPMDDLAVEALKKRRLGLKDQIFARLTG